MTVQRLFFIGGAVLCYVTYRICIKPYRYWKIRNVIYESPKPLFGNLASFVFGKKSFVDLHNEIYSKDIYEKRRYIGLYHFQTPAFLIKDPKLIKELLVENFEVFPERTVLVPKELDPIWAKSLFSLSGTKEWKCIKSTINTLFTGTKLRKLFDSTGAYITALNNYIQTHIEGDTATLVATDLFSKIANDLMVKLTFGESCNSFEDPNNEIFTLGKDISNITGIRKSLKFFLAGISVNLAKLLKICFIDEPTADKLRIRMETKSRQFDRKKEGSDQLDLISVLMKARNEQYIRPDRNKRGSGSPEDVMYAEFTDDVILAQLVVFIFGGLDTLSRALSFAAYELAVNPDIQERLRNEIDIIEEVCQGNVDFNNLTEIKYLDNVIYETLRKWPPIAIVDRKPVKSFWIKHPAGIRYEAKIDKQVVCLVPVFSIHRDPVHYENPDEFNPDRFKDEERDSRYSVFMPFGIGRRACVGSRFAVLMMKIVLYHILCKYEIVTLEETPIPLQLSKTSVNPVPDRDLVLGFRLRN